MPDHLPYEEEEAGDVRRARDYAESIVETLHEPLVVLEPDLRVRTVNPAFYEQFQVREPETIGRVIYELGNGQWDIPELRTLLEDVLPDSQIFNDYEVRHEFKGIGERVMLLNARRLDHVQLILLGIRDITERVRSEEEARDSEALQAFLLTLSDALRPLADTLEIQATAARILGERLKTDWAYYVEIDEQNDEFVVAHDWHRPGVQSRARRYPLSDWPMPGLGDGRTWVVRDTETDPAMPDDQRDAYRDNGVGAAVVVPLIKEDRLVATFAVNQRDARQWTAQEVALVEGTAERTWAAVERARAEEALKASEARFRAVADLVPDLLWQADPRGRRVWGNQRWMEYTGQTPYEALEDGWTGTVHPEDLEAALEVYKAAIATREPYQHEHRIRRADGAYRWFLVRAEPVRDDDGGIREWIGSATDVHEHRELMDTLEARVAKRTREVRDLAETLSVAEQEERQRLSHLLHDDLQQLLYGVQMKLTLARDHAQREDLEGVVAHTERSLKLLDDAIARTRQLTVDLNPPILEGEGLLGAIEWLRTQMRDLHGLKVEIHAEIHAEGGTEIHVQPPDLRILLFQITRELLFNVAKHAGTDRAVVTVGKDDGRVRVTVADEGKGFEPAALGGSPGSRGGLGLFSARERLRLRGGDLSIESVPGNGSRIVAYAPLSSGS